MTGQQNRKWFLKGRFQPWGVLVSLLLFSGCYSWNADPEKSLDTEPILPPSQTPPTGSLEVALSHQIPSIQPPPGQLYLGEEPPVDYDQLQDRPGILPLLRSQIIPLFEDGTFHPEEPLTRGEALLWIYNLLAAKGKTASLEYHLKGAMLDPATGQQDGSTHYFAPLAARLTASGLLAGYEDFLSAPDQDLRRDEFAAILWAFEGRGTASNTSQRETCTLPGSQPPDTEEDGEEETESSQPHSSPSNTLQKRYVPGLCSLLYHGQTNLFQVAFLPDAKNISHFNQMALETPVTRAQAAHLIFELEETLGQRL